MDISALNTIHFLLQSIKGLYYTSVTKSVVCLNNITTSVLGASSNSLAKVILSIPYNLVLDIQILSLFVVPQPHLLPLIVFF